MDNYAIASFRSRSQVLRFEQMLTKEKIRAEIINTPKEVALGCGLSVKLDVLDLDRAREVYYRNRPTSFVGFYVIERTGAKVKVYGSRADI